MGKGLSSVLCPDYKCKSVRRLSTLQVLATSQAGQSSWVLSLDVEVKQRKVDDSDDDNTECCDVAASTTVNQ